jgi:hypothetical protein
VQITVSRSCKTRAKKNALCKFYAQGERKLDAYRLNCLLRLSLNLANYGEQSERHTVARFQPLPGAHSARRAREKNDNVGFHWPGNEGKPAPSRKSSRVFCTRYTTKEAAHSGIASITRSDVSQPKAPPWNETLTVLAGSRQHTGPARLRPSSVSLF